MLLLQQVSSAVMGTTQHPEEGDAMSHTTLTREANLRLRLCTRSPLEAQVVGTVAFLKGEARDASELLAVMRAIQAIPGVETVISRAMKDSRERARESPRRGGSSAPGGQPHHRLPRPYARAHSRAREKGRRGQGEPVS
jgi:hypothetical protein